VQKGFAVERCHCCGYMLVEMSRVDQNSGPEKVIAAMTY